MFLSALLAAALGAPPADMPGNRPDYFEFKDGDRIVWLGGTFVEREQRYGHWETALLAANADKNIRVRNLGWSGDTVLGEARASFDFNKPDAGFKLLVDQALGVTPPPPSWLARVAQRVFDEKYAFRPTVIFVCYGTNESFEGKDGLVRVDTVQRTAEVGARPLDLTYLEFELLAHLVAHPNRVHTRDQLVTTVWGYGHVGDGRTVDVHIARLRRKLGAEFRQAIRTVRRVGYKYTPPPGR